MHVLFQNIASILNSKKILLTLKYYVCKTMTLTSHVLHSDCISASTTFVLPSHTSGFIFLPCRNTNCLYSISCFVFPSRHFFITFFSFCMNSIDNCFNCLPAFISEGDDMFQWPKLDYSSAVITKKKKRSCDLSVAGENHNNQTLQENTSAAVLYY